MNIADVPQLEMHLNTETKVLHMVHPDHPWLAGDGDNDPLALCGTATTGMEPKTALEVEVLLRRPIVDGTPSPAPATVCQNCVRSGVFRGMHGIVRMLVGASSGALRLVVRNKDGDL